MKEGFEDCPELAGKTITQFRIFRDGQEGVECEIEFDDGTRFNITVEHRPQVEASLSRPGPGSPEELTRHIFPSS